MVDFAFIVFCAFSFLLLAAALGVVLSRNPVHSSLFLVLAFLSSAGVWMLLEAEFLALLIVLVYVGAVMVLFLFVIMMLDINLDVLREGFWRYLPLAAAAAALVAAEITFVLYAAPFFDSGRYPLPPPPEENVRAIAALLYTDYAFVLELAAALLLAAIVAAVALTLRRRRGVKYVDPAVQVRASRAGRVRLVSMPAVHEFSQSKEEKL
ncbi:MAG: NADH-quinone oxidoreductase subunit J [Betaproteobacteria bacterium]|nr:NADH-quinone oxidoreductase subunit J [Betaproteobacteria bacterium]